MSREKIKVPDGIASLIPYPPGKPIEELERELGISGSIKLASNENPIGPSKKAIEAVKAELSGLNRYPDGSNFYLKRKLSERLGVSEDMLFTGNGSNEIIEILMRTFLQPGDSVVMGSPSFAVYPLVTQAAGCEAIEVPLKADLTYDMEKMVAAITGKTKIVFIANPNNPTGTMLGAEEFSAFMEAVPGSVIICMDEAYCEYVTSTDYPDSLSYVKAGRPVVVMRTFSKIYGLAGLRAGYGVGPEYIIDYMNRVRQPFNMNTLAQAAALAALDDDEHIEKSLENNRNGLDYLFGEFSALGFECVPTEANFFLVKVGDGANVYDALLKRGVIVRPMAGYGLGEYIRVTVGLPDENRRLIDTIKELGISN